MDMAKRCFAGMAAVLFLALAGGCSWFQTGGDELTPDEYGALVDYARGVVKGISSKKLTDAEKRRIMAEKPIFGVHYRGHKEGQFKLKWVLNQGEGGDFERSVTYRGDGDMLDFAGSCRGVVLNGKPSAELKF